MFQNREDAGIKLAEKIKKTLKSKNYVVVGIVRGGIVVAKVIADALNAELKAVVVRKIGALFNSELAIGAVGSGKVVYWDESLIKKLKIKVSYKSSALKEKFEEVKILEEKFSIDKKGLDFAGKRVIIIDDGVATGATVLCAQKVIKRQGSKEIILATPVISKESYEYIKSHFDKIIVLKVAEDFSAVGQFYKDFPQVEDEEVVDILAFS